MTFSKLAVERAKEWGLYAFLFLVPTFYLTNALDQRVVQERFFQGATMCLASLFLGNIWLTLFLWLNMVLFCVNGATVGASQVFSVFLTGVLFACSRNFFETRSIKKYANSLYVVALISLIFVILQIFSLDPSRTGVGADGKPTINESFTLQTGLLFLPAFNAIFLTVVAALMVFLSSWVGFLFIVPLITAKCSSAFLGFGFLAAFYFQFKKLPIIRTKSRVFRLPIFLANIIIVNISKVLIALMFLGVIGLTIYDYKNDKLTYSSRFESWHLFIRKALDYPLGYGPDSFRNYTKRKNFVFQTDRDYNPILSEKVSKDVERVSYYSADQGRKIERFGDKFPVSVGTWSEAHNEYIQLFFEYGIIGLIILFGFFKEIYDRFILSEKTDEVLALFSVLVIFALVSITQFPFHLARLSGIFGILLGAYWAKTDKGYLTFKEGSYA